MANTFYRPVIFIVLTVLVLGQPEEGVRVVRRCAHSAEYGEHCTYVPAPPGRTPACAAPGYTYCEQLDYYPKDLIRHLVDKKQFDLSTLLSDESRDDFGATRPSQGPYGYGPNSLRGAQHISLVAQQPAGLNGGPEHYYPAQEPVSGNPHYRGNTLPPPKGYVGYYTPSDSQRPSPYPSSFPPTRDSYLPPEEPRGQKARGGPNSTRLGGGGWAPEHFRPGVNLDQYEDFWRGNSYFEVPKSPSFSDFHRNNVGLPAEYYDNNAGRPYYSPGFAPAAYPPAHGAEGGPRRRAPQRPQRAQRPPLTVRSASDWWQRNSQENSPSDRTSMPAVDSNDLKSKTFSKRDTSPSLTDDTDAPNKSQAAKNPLLAGREDGQGGRKRRQAGGTGGPGAEQLCPTRSQYITPRAALNKQGNWMYVVNMGDSMDPAYSQLVKTETCVSQQCNGLCSLPLGYNSRCEQRYVQKRLVALDQGGQRLYNDVFWFPSCCLCTISANQT